jgi:hypothetical protein
MAAQSIAKQMASQEDRLLRKGSNGQGFGQIRQRHLWSTYVFHSAAGGSIDPVTGILTADEFPIFVAPEGSFGQGLPQGQVLTKRETNFPGANRVSDDQNFSIWEYGISVLGLRDDLVDVDPDVMTYGPVLPSDVDLVLENMQINITYLTNSVPLGQCSDFCQPGGPSIVSPTEMDYTQGTNLLGTTGGLSEGSLVKPYGERVAKMASNGGGIPAAPALRRKLEIPIYLKNAQTFSFKFVASRDITLAKVTEGGTGGFAMRLDWWAVESFREQG